jgi:hypothetical protein
MSFLDTISGLLRRDVIAMSNIFPKESGVSGAILWVNPGTVEGKKIKHGPRLKVIVSGTSKSVSVTISKPPRVLGKLPNKVEKDVLAFIALNHELLLQFWNDENLSSKEFLNRIKPLG